MELKKALSVAQAIVEKLSPLCTVINIAGSIRRQKPEVKDIEIVCLPKTISIPYGDMFDQRSVDVVDEKCGRQLAALGKIIKGKFDGKMMQIELPEGIMLDLFMPNDFDYYRQYAIRTGSAEYSHKVIASGWNKIGWCGSNLGLRKISDCIKMEVSEGKYKWHCSSTNAEKPPVWKSEEDFFEWINVKFVQPSERNI